MWCRMEGERDCHATDSSKAGKNDDDCAVRWTVEEVSKENKMLSPYIITEIFLHIFYIICIYHYYKKILLNQTSDIAPFLIKKRS